MLEKNAGTASLLGWAITEKQRSSDSLPPYASFSFFCPLNNILISGCTLFLKDTQWVLLFSIFILLAIERWVVTYPTFMVDFCLPSVFWSSIVKMHTYQRHLPFLMGSFSVVRLSGRWVLLSCVYPVNHVFFIKGLRSLACVRASCGAGRGFNTDPCHAWWTQKTRDRSVWLKGPFLEKLPMKWPYRYRFYQTENTKLFPSVKSQQGSQRTQLGILHPPSHNICWWALHRKPFMTNPFPSSSNTPSSSGSNLPMSEGKRWELPRDRGCHCVRENLSALEWADSSEA